MGALEGAVRNTLIISLVLGFSLVLMGLLIGGRFTAVAVANSNDFHGYVVVLDRLTGETRILLR